MNIFGGHFHGPSHFPHRDPSRRQKNDRSMRWAPGRGRHLGLGGPNIPALFRLLVGFVVFVVVALGVLYVLVS